MIRVLLVEDDVSYATPLTEALTAAVAGIQITHVRSRDAAFNEIVARPVDLVICDLRIPTTDGALDDAVEHGLAVHARARDVAKGTPVLILSAYGTIELVRDLLRNAFHEDLFGTGESIPMSDFIQKGNPFEVLDRVRQFNDHLDRLDEIEVSSGAVAIDLSLEERRVLKIFARRNHGRVVRVAPLGGGLSSARVLRVRVDDEYGARRASCVAKIGLWDKIDDERERYRRHVAPLLGPGTYTPEADIVRAGGGRIAGIYYALADGHDRSMFDVVRANTGDASQIIARLRDIEAGWQIGAPVSAVPVRTIRRLLIADDVFASRQAELGGIDFPQFEQRTVQTRRCTGHGDLHGLNILTGPPGQVVLIDYGEVIPEAPAALDPVTLELSFLFHTGSADIRGSWPSVAQASLWHRLDDYVAGCPCEPVVRQCRQWAHEVAASAGEVYACAYAYAVRQLKYNDTDHDLARAIATSAIEAYRA